MKTPDVEIRPYRLGDADDLYEAVRESVAEMSPWLAWCHADYSLDEARAWVEGRMEQSAAGNEYAYTIRDAEGEFVGGCGLNCIQPAHRIANLGYWVRTSRAGHGFAPAAVGKLAALAFETLDLARLEIVCAVDNRRSQRVAERAGALREALLRDRLWGADGPQDAVLYALLRSGRHLGGADAPTIRREAVDSAVALGLITALNAELKAEYPGEGQTFFRLDPDEVAAGRGAFLVLYLAGVPFGCGAVRKLDDRTAEIKRMYVASGLRGQGLGQRLLDALEAEARRLGVARVVLETGPRQLRALALYRRHGFTHIPAYGEYVTSPVSVCMAKDL